MAMEIERKFLVRNDDWRQSVTHSRHICQGYLDGNGTLAIRIRILDKSSARLTIKSAEPGIQRSEFEYPIPLADAEQLLELRRGALIVKTRHIVPWQGAEWEIDVFEGKNAGLVIAEIELEDEAAHFERPDWLGDEITEDARYYNASLVERPFTAWSGSGPFS